jgi:tRNA pseudouridine55 synthase
MFGLLNVDKPPRLTSRDVVNRVQRLVKPHKTGHAGTLDPLATGVLLVAVGHATRLVEYVQRMPKTYQATFLLGRTSDTEDVDGAVSELDSPPVPDLHQVENAARQLVGTIEQRPPAYSAVKVSGQRAYKQARRGDTFELAPRPVEIYSIDVLRYEYPQLELLVRCGSGTYVRSLGRDLAQSLGSGAVMSALRRLAIGRFDVREALAYDAITLPEICQRLLPASLATEDLPQVVVDGDECSRLSKGQTIVNRFRVSGEEIAALDSSGRLVAILVPAGRLELRPTKCLIAS